MSDADRSTHVNDDEFILRRIPRTTGWYDPQTDLVASQAFRPTKRDTTGLSVTRAKSDAHPEFRSAAEDAAAGGNPSGYYVAVVRVGDLRAYGIDVVSKPELPEHPGHAEIPLLTYATRKSDEATDAMSLLAGKLIIRVEGPFEPDSPSGQDDAGT
jgi:hypothetical protein